VGDLVGLMRHEGRGRGREWSRTSFLTQIGQVNTVLKIFELPSF